MPIQKNVIIIRDDVDIYTRRFKETGASFAIIKMPPKENKFKIMCGNICD
jgi:hypothetical protein